MYVFTQPLHNEQDMTQGQFLSRVQLVLNSKFSFFCLNKVKELSLRS